LLPLQGLFEASLLEHDAEDPQGPEGQSVPDIYPTPLVQARFFV
jgi:hypothetical protein